MHAPCAGTYAEYMTASEDFFALVPPNLDLKIAGAVPLAALTAFQVCFLAFCLAAESECHCECEGHAIGLTANMQLG